MPPMTPNADALTRIHDDAGPLRAVRYVQDENLPTFPVGVILEFEILSATILAEPNYDEILVRLTPYEPKSGEKVVAVGTEDPWLEMYGLSVLWTWRMTNQQGYTDGLRLEFGDPDDNHKSRTVEMVVAASSIKLFAVGPTTADMPQPQSVSPLGGADPASLATETTEHNFVPPGNHPLETCARFNKMNPVDFHLEQLGTFLRWNREHFASFKHDRESDPDNAERELAFLDDTIERGYEHLERLSELLRAGFRATPGNK